MLISNSLPQVSALQTANAAATQSAALSAAAASASRPMTPAAVNAAAAASPYSPQLPQPRRQATEQPTAAPTDTKGGPSILPDPEFWRVPNRQASMQPQPLPVRTPTETVQQTTGFVAQAMAQDMPEMNETEEPQPAPVPRKPASLVGKKPGLGDSSGFGAYVVASQRNTELTLPSTVEAFA